MSHWRRSPRQVALAVDRIRGQLVPDTLLAEVQGCWREAVGPGIAAEAQPSAERGGVLTVSCSASVWAHELDLMAPVIIERLNGSLGAARISRLRCVAVPVRDR
jgi:predicted nucleic acid-binding Zn ribbon protein